MVIEAENIMKVLEHRYPFLLVDRILEFEYENFAVACKNISVNEPWASGHFTGNPIYPGALLIESSAQTGAFLFYDPQAEDHSSKGMLANVENFKFVRVVKPGDQIIIKTTLVQKFGNFVKVRVKASVEEKRVAEGELTYVLS